MPDAQCAYIWTGPHVGKHQAAVLDPSDEAADCIRVMPNMVSCRSELIVEPQAIPGPAGWSA